MKYAGPWTSAQAAHLLRRTCFSYDQSMINQVVDDGLDISLDKILELLPDTEPPINYDYEFDPETPIGQSWVDKGFTNLQGLNSSRRRSLTSWMMGLYFEKNQNIREKMTLFWINHFVTADIQDPRFSYRYYKLLQDNCLGDFRQLTKDMTVNPSMLRYLNGNENVKEAPNENYARELLELFTIGKGPLIGPGDYTNYTEDDIKAIAKILTGWKDSGHTNPNNPEVKSIFNSNKHDQTDKQLSSKFNNAIIVNNEEGEYEDLIDVIFEQEEVSRHIVRCLYRWFIFHDITDEIESNEIEAWAKVLRDNDYVIKPVMRAMLESELFYDDEMIGCMIKSPIDFLIGVLSFFNVENPYEGEILNSYTYWDSIYNASFALQQEVLEPPSVAGWSAYYQEPTYYRVWLNSVTLPIRLSVSDVLASTGFGNGDAKLIIDPFKLLENVSDPVDLELIVKELSSFALCHDLSEGQIDFLIETMMQGLPKAQWTLEYNAYTSDPTNDALKTVIEFRLRYFLVTLLRLPEYQLS